MNSYATWSVDPGTYAAGVALQAAKGIEEDVVAFVDGMTDEVAAWLRANHRWENRTGDAEAGLYADVEHVLHESVYLLISHGPAVEYAWFLEANPRYAVLGDAADHFWPVLLRGVQEIVRRHSSGG